jgi:hypothetical protein
MKTECNQIARHSLNRNSNYIGTGPEYSTRKFLTRDLKFEHSGLLYFWDIAEPEMMVHQQTPSSTSDVIWVDLVCDLLAFGIIDCAGRIRAKNLCLFR